MNSHLLSMIYSLLARRVCSWAGSSLRYPLSFARFSSKSATIGAVDKGEHHLLPRLYVGIPPKLTCLSSLEVIEIPSNRTASSHLYSNAVVDLNAEQSHYLSTVLRIFKKKQSPYIRLFDGVSGEYLARILDSGGISSRSKSKREGLQVECLTQLRTMTSPNDPVWLCIAPPKKKERVRWLLEKATELSVGTFCLLESDFSASPAFGFEKLQAYVTEAAEQSERLTVPRFVHLATDSLSDPKVFVTPLRLFLEQASHHRTMKVLLLRERTNASPVLKALADCHAPNTQSAPVSFVIGPEGGWSKDEEKYMDELQATYPDVFVNVSLGPTVLRAETAACAALSAHMIFHDDLERPKI